MKLNYKRTVLVGFAFFLTLSFWGAYDAIVPLILGNRFHMDEVTSGFIMSLDNIFAVVMLPLFGALSDRVKTPLGKRTPFIIAGTLVAALALSALGFVTSLPLFITVLFVALLAMAVFRSPAVALMPDITVRPLRSKGNAIINLMGAAGGIVALVLAEVFGTSEKGKTDFGGYLIAIAAVMLVSLIVFLLTVKENKWAKEAEEAGRVYESEPEDNAEKRKLNRSELVSLCFLLASVALWYIGYNAITTKYSLYATNVLEVSYSTTLLIAQAAAIVSYVPVGIIASRFGRKRVVLAGVLMLAVAFGAAAFITKGSSPYVMYFLFALAGIGWATINVNSFPMVVELAAGGDVGKYTGYYYTASMAAQIVTPVLSGVFLQHVGWWTFFPYATIFVSASFVTMLFVKHGGSPDETKTDTQTEIDAEI